MAEKNPLGERFGPKKPLELAELRKEYKDSGSPTFAEDTPLKQVDAILWAREGETYGPGMDVPSPEIKSNVGDMVQQGGSQYSIMVDDAGRFTLYPDSLSKLIRKGVEPQRKTEFWSLQKTSENTDFPDLFSQLGSEK